MEPTGSVTIKPAENDWPYPEMEADWHAASDVWRQVSEAFYWQNLEVLPPVYVHGGFMVGEPYTYTPTGDSVRALFAEVNGQHYGQMCARREAANSCARLRVLLGFGVDRVPLHAVSA